LKKRMVGIAIQRTRHNKIERFKVKGWKVNPYIFVHKTLNSNHNPVGYSSWNVTFIPTGYAIATRVALSNSLTLSRFIELTDKWFPAWIMKNVSKKMNASEELRIRHQVYLKQIKLYQQTEELLEV